MDGAVFGFLLTDALRLQARRRCRPRPSGDGRLRFRGGWFLDEHLAYVSSDRGEPTPFARAFEVLEVLPFKDKQLRAALRARGIGPLTTKKHGVQVTPEALHARLGLTGPTPATLILSRTPRSSVALLVEPR